MEDMTTQQFKAFLKLLRKDIIRIEELEELDQIKEELKQEIEIIREMIED